MRLAGAMLLGGLVVTGCGKNDGGTGPDTPPTAVYFQLRNQGATPRFLFQSCVLDLTITSLANPADTIGRGGGCACSCGDSTCTGAILCGACFEGSHEVAPATTMPYAWGAADISYESRGSYTCARVDALPAGRYRIDVPVYVSAEDAAAKTNARIVSQTFDLPAATVIVPLE